MTASDLVPDSDIMGGLTPGITKLTLRDLATMMVAVSDNSATNVLIDRVGMDNVNSLMSSLGLKHTLLRRKMMDLKAAGEGRENVSTPREMATLLEQLYRQKVLNKEMTDDFFKVLSTHKDSWIPRYLPEGLKMANKPGSLEGVRNDSGVIFRRTSPLHHLRNDHLSSATRATAKKRSPTSRNPPTACSIASPAPANTVA